MTLETLFTIGALAAALGLLFRKQRRGAFAATAAICLTASALIGLVAINLRPAPNDATAPTDRPLEVAQKGYITSDSCKSCHPREYDSWHDSFHRSMTQIASPKTVLGNFDDLTVEASGYTYRLFRKGEEFWVEMDRFIDETYDDQPAPTPSIEEPKRVERQIIQTTGSHNMQIYWFSTGTTRILGQLPLVWLNAEKRWTPRNACFLMPPDAQVSTENGRWNGGCIACHTTRGRPQMIGLSEMYTESTEFGIACEACHGPAENHVAINSNPARRYGQRMTDSADESIVNPVQLRHRHDSQVCGQCHSLRRPATIRDEQKFALDGAPYQPGQNLEQRMLVVTMRNTNAMRILNKNVPDYQRNRFWSDGMVRISGREFNGLIETPCFTHDQKDRRMSCFSCHAMHRPTSDTRPLEEWTDDQLKPGMRTDQACLQCHSDYSADIPAHSHHSADSSGSRCYNCHMPHTTYGLLKAIRSHQVSVPTARESVETGRPNACNLCHLDKTLEWTADRLQEWFDIEKPPLTKDHTRISAAAIWALNGDAGQRALIAWSMGWKPAQEVSGTDWLPAYLGQSLLDPIDAVRFIAWRSLRGLDGYSEFSYDYVAPVEDRFAVAQQVRERWQSKDTARPNAANPNLLMTGPGQISNAEFHRLISTRDNFPLYLAE